MANLRAYIDAPLFYDDTELSASLLNIIRNNSEAIKNAVLLPQPAFDIHRGIFGVVQNSLDLWKGGFQYRTGLTSAIFIIYSKQVSGGGEHNIKIYFDDVLVDSYDAAIGGINVGGYSGRAITLTGRGYIDLQIVTVRISPEPIAGGGSDDATKNVYYVLDGYVEPLSSVSVGSWPGTPTFGTIDSTKLNQLANASDYLANRLSIVPMPLGMSYIQWMGTNNPKFVNFRYFTARATNGNNLLKTNVYYRCQQTEAYIDLTVGGVVTSSGPYTVGQQPVIQFNFDMIANGLSWDTDYLSSLTERVTIAGNPSDGHGGYIYSRIDNGPIRMGADSYSITPIAPENLMRESLTYAQVQTRLNNLGDDLLDAYTTLTDNIRVFDRATMFRGRFGISAAQNEYWSSTFMPSIYRQGDVLWVKGQGVKIMYGSVTQKPKSDAKPNDVIEYEFQYTHDLLDGDKVTQQYFYLDQFTGLYPGMRYFLAGKDIHYAAEHLR